MNSYAAILSIGFRETITEHHYIPHYQTLQKSLIDASLGESGAFDENHCSVFSSHIYQSEPNRYIYHSDHLGSSAFLTDASGDPTQHLQYMPFGENFIEQRSITSYYTPYTFSAKERDTETGYSYFGARYYSSEISIWLSVDPMADKYPSMSPYMYCAGNPVMLVDPDGRKFDYSKLSKSEKKMINKEIRHLRFKSKTFRTMYRQMNQSETVYTFIKYKADISSENLWEKASGYCNNGKIGWGDENPSTLVQEMFHGYQEMKENSEIYRGSTITDQEAEGEVATYYIMNEVSSKKKNRYLPMGGIKDIVQKGNIADIILMDVFKDYKPSPNRKEAGSKEFDRKYQEFKKSFVDHNSDGILGERPKNYQGAITNAKAVGLMKLLKAE
jgi:RHS repeat-associated protein